MIYGPTDMCNDDNAIYDEGEEIRTLDPKMLEWRTRQDSNL
ncbi:MAG: hypothetical protein U0S50_09215 [Sphingopyxis sp.]|nr:hypothetical protein [Sphingopyxis sp.]MDZ3831980.1 hypothetical protein [Sphingopyxis sp.]